MGIKMRWSQNGSSAGLWNWAKYGCLNASSAVIRFSGLNWRSFCNKSAAWWLARGKSYSVDGLNSVCKEVQRFAYLCSFLWLWGRKRCKHRDCEWRLHGDNVFVRGFSRNLWIHQEILATCEPTWYQAFHLNYAVKLIHGRGARENWLSGKCCQL